MSRKSKGHAIAKTNAMRELDRAKIAYTARTYEHGEDDGSTLGLQIAEQLGEDPASSFKTLVCVAPDGDHVVCCIPVACELDLKRAAAASGHKSLSMIHVADIEPTTGYVRGGCSPLCMKKPFRTVFHESAGDIDRIIVSAGKIGYQIDLAPSELLRLSGGTLADIIKESV